MTFLPAETLRAADLAADFRDPPTSAKPWTFWYWMHAAVTREGITADLEAMRDIGIGGAYLTTIKGATTPPHVDPPAPQLGPGWWELVRHAFVEADRLGLELGMMAGDGFATAGGPWITPELSMQKVVWTTTHVDGGARIEQALAQPETIENYYRDLAVLAFPSLEGAGVSTRTVVPRITASDGTAPLSFLATGEPGQRYRSEVSCWIQYAFAEAFTCHSITIRPDGPSPQAHRLRVEASDDGAVFRFVADLEIPRHGWQDEGGVVTHALPATTAKYFRFVHDPEGIEPGAEDLDSAKWRPVFKVRAIELSSEPRIHAYEGKSGAVWRVARHSTAADLPTDLCVPREQIVELTTKVAPDGRLTWDAPPGRWTILRFGHTSTGHRNATAGAGQGLECDKFNPEAARQQFDHWFGEAMRQAGPELARRALRVFHVDSWECGSQNWSSVFRDEFTRRRGYDLLTFLPAMAGIPVESAVASEKFLHDVRRTIGELVLDNFYAPLTELVRAHGGNFSGECTAPTMVGDGLAHFGQLDVPMGEFWLRSPTHDKLNDMLDAISGARIYGKPIVAAEAFTQLRMAWDEHPAMLKALGDRNYALGVNRFVYHVFAHNPWLDRGPGMTLDGVGLYFQRDQTWWEPGRAWVKYAQRCQVLLQHGRPVVDIAVFTGEESPSRAVRPDQLVDVLPGLFGAEQVAREHARRANRGRPLRELPRGVTHAANIVDASDWADPLRGYQYDSINRDALLRRAAVQNGRLELPGGARYSVLVLPGARPMDPAGDALSPELASRLEAFSSRGVTVLREPVHDDSLQAFGVEPDLVAREADDRRAEAIAWTHRASPQAEIYFVSNQRDVERTVDVSLRVSGRVPELWDAVTGEMRRAGTWRSDGGRTRLPLRLAPGGSIFIVLREVTAASGASDGRNWSEPRTALTLSDDWQVQFDPAAGGPEGPQTWERLVAWNEHNSHDIRHYSGTATYTQTFTWSPAAASSTRVWLDLGRVATMAEISVNGVPCGVAWTAPWRVDITNALRADRNVLEISVTNTWANRLSGDHARPEAERITWTTAPYRLDGQPLLEAGLLGPVEILVQ